MLKIARILRKPNNFKLFRHFCDPKINTTKAEIPNSPEVKPTIDFENNTEEKKSEHSDEKPNFDKDDNANPESGNRVVAGTLLFLTSTYGLFRVLTNDYEDKDAEIIADKMLGKELEELKEGK